MFRFLAPARDFSPLLFVQIASGTHPVLKSVGTVGEDSVTGTESNSVMTS